MIQTTDFERNPGDTMVCLPALDRDGQLAWWLAHLEGPPTLALPTDSPRASSWGDRTESHRLELAPPLVHGLQALAREQSTVEFMVLLAAFKLLLARYTGQQDLLVGTATQDDQGNALTLVLRCQLDPRAGFREFLGSVKSEVHHAFSFRDVPFETLRGILEPQPDPVRHPLFQVMFSKQSERECLSDRPLDLHVALKPDGETLYADLTYNSDLFREQTIRAMAGHWVHLLTALCLDPDAPVGRLNILAPSEREQVLTGFNQTEMPWPQQMNLVSWVERQVALTPDTGAVSDDCEPPLYLSYTQLNQRANRLAHYLAGRGVGVDMLVGICMRRSVDLMVAILGIMKVGAAYVPLDPDQPSQRLKQMLADTDFNFVLGQSFTQHYFPEDTECLCMDQADMLLANYDHRNLEVVPHDNHLAYVIYTSGSTGTPKGVMNAHQGILNRLFWMKHHLSFGPDDRLVQKTSYSFDVSVGEMFLPLIVGAQLVFARDGGQRDPFYLVSLLKRERITIVHFVPSMIGPFLEAMRGQQLNDLKHVLCGGELFSGALRDRFLEIMGSTRLHNLYGPTEAAIDVTVHLCEPGESDENVPIGKPVSNTCIYILDSYLQPVPIGVVGELYVGGVNVCRGYRAQPALTADRFLPNPFGGHGTRLYRTGDLARQDRVGRIHYIGRVDFQVKLRGYRIETGEIEARLLRRDDIANALVMVRQDQPGQDRLVAYIIPSGTSVTVRELREYLSQQLPHYMIPAVFVFLAEYPQLPSGKVNRKALPLPPTTGETHEMAPLETENQVALAAIWCQILGLEQIGRQGHFFELGGHSLSAALLLTAVRSRLGRALSFEDIFAYPRLEALAQRLETSATKVSMNVIPLIEPEQEVPLSFAQNGLWFIDKLNPGNTAYNMPFAVRIRGPLNTMWLMRGLELISQRHEVLRTVFCEEGTRVLQRVMPQQTVELSVHDLSQLQVMEQEDRLKREMAEQVARPFDLAAAPLWRCLLYRLSESDHVFLCNMHHLISDGWSISLLMEELAQAYDAYSMQLEPELVVLPCQYADFSQWQRQDLEGETFVRHLDWWRESLHQGENPLELATDWPRGAIQTFEGNQVPVYLSPALVSGLNALAQTERATLYMTLLAAFGTLLHRYSGQSNISLGSPVANRSHESLVKLIGFFVNTLVMSADCSGDPSFLELLARVKKHALGAFSRGDVPFDRLVAELAPERDLSRNPLFQVMFALHNTPALPKGTRALAFQHFPVPWGKARFDLSLLMDEPALDGSLSGVLEYNRHLFEEATAQAMVAHFEILLSELIEHPTSPISSLAMMAEPERRKLLVDWNQTAKPKFELALIHHLFERMVFNHGEEPALVCEGRTFSYNQIAQQARRQAMDLRRLGISRDKRVGICMARGEKIVTSMLAVLMSRAAYVPMDPTYPREHLAFIAKDTELNLVLCDESSEQVLQGLNLALSRPIWEHDGPVFEPLTHLMDVAETAYILYTSGSTGRPKGVVIAHASVAHLIHWAGNTFTREDLTGTLAATSINFDLSIFEIFATLCLGGKVVMVPSILALVDESFNEPVRLINSVPSAVNELVRLKALPVSVRVVNLAGEPIPVKLLQALYEHGGIERVYNLYGPSEDTTYSTQTLLARAENQRVTIGNPIEHSQCYVLDSRARAVPTGVAGELYLGGMGLASGYLKRPGLSAQKFVPNPYVSGENAGSRLYRTGDRVRYLQDGRLCFLGRVDFQVKLRGFRIEPGEIESVLESHEAVEKAVVTVLNANLQAHVSCPGDVAGEALRDYLAQRLPGYMVPAGIRVMKQLPLLPNGKVNRRGLPPVELKQTDQASLQTPMEERLAALWGEFLDLDQVSRNDDFFRVGGHSLLATRVLLRLGLGRDGQALRIMFDKPVLCEMAAELAQRPGVIKQEPLPIKRLDRSDRTLQAPLSSAQQRLWFLDRLEPGNPAYHLSMAYRIQGRLDRNTLGKAFHLLIDRHEILRTDFPAPEGQPVQRVNADCPFRLHFEDYSYLEDEEPEDVDGQIETLARKFTLKTFDLGSGPLLRACLVKLGSNDHLLLVCQHHIISDGWSLGIFFGELGGAYDILEKGEQSELPALSVHYADYAVWQQQNDPDHRADLDWWQARLASASTLALPHDKPRPKVRTFRGGQLCIEVPEPLCAAVTALGEAHNASRFMTFLSIFKLLLARYTGQQDIIVGTPRANRNHPDTEAMLGIFVNTLVLRHAYDPQAGFVQWLTQVRDSVLDVFSHEVPFEELVKVLDPERDHSRNPLFQVLFSLHHTPGYGFPLASKRTNRVVFDQRTSQFDLGLYMWQEGGSMRAEFIYNSDLFSKSFISSMARHWHALTASVVAGAKLPMGQLDLLEPKERKNLLQTFNDTGRSWPERRNLVAWIEARVMQCPDALAVSDDGDEPRHLSYAQLNQEANRLAHCLRGRGAGLELPVGVCLRRSVNMIVALLGVLKAGAAYLPMDPDYPTQRLIQVLDGTPFKLVVTESGTQEALPPEAEPLCLDLSGDHLAAFSSQNPDVCSGDSHLAYVIYTSGSTGNPKGVMNAHAGVVNRLLWMEDYLKLETEDRILQKTAYSFDVSVWEFFLPLMIGAQIVFARDGGHRDPIYILDLMKRERITVCHFVPSMLGPFLEALRGETLPKLKHVVCSGEALSGALRDQFLASMGQTSLHNLYGPTEAAIDVTFHLCRQGEREGSVPIGKPIANTAIYLLDRSYQLVPVGVVGELYIGGDNVGRGYRNQASLTAQRFLPDAFGTCAPGQRLYRTGDLARCDLEGRIYYIGRADFQVKLRGFRIETGEIEVQLSHHESISAALVMVREDHPGQTRLVAYILTPDGQKLGDDPAAFLSARLPHYMVPAAFVSLAAFPLLPSGKVDRKALPLPEEGIGDVNCIPPRDGLESRLVSIWEKLLKRSGIGIRNDFFHLGGHSLLIVNMMYEIKRQLAVSLPVTVLYEHPTIEFLAEGIRRQAGAEVEATPLVGLKTSGRRRPLFLVHALGGHVLRYVQLAQLMDEEQPLYALEDRERETFVGIEEKAAEYIRAIRKQQAEGPYLIGGWSMGGLIALEIAQQLKAAQEQVACLFLLDAPLAIHMLQRKPKPADKLFTTLDGSVQAMLYFAADLQKSCGPFEVTGSDLEDLDEQGRYDFIINAARSQGLLQTEYELEMVQRLYRVSQANLKVQRGYEGLPYEGKVVLVTAESTNQAQRAAVHACDWEGLISPHPTIIDVPGDHEGMLQEPRVRILRDHLETFLVES